MDSSAAAAGVPAAIRCLQVRRVKETPWPSVAPVLSTENVRLDLTTWCLLGWHRESSCKLQRTKWQCFCIDRLTPAAATTTTTTETKNQRPTAAAAAAAADADTEAKAALHCNHLVLTLIFLSRHSVHHHSLIDPSSFIIRPLFIPLPLVLTSYHYY